MLEKLKIKTYKMLCVLLVFLVLFFMVFIFALYNQFEISLSREVGLKFTPRDQNRQIVNLSSEIQNIKQNTVTKQDYNKLVYKIYSLQIKATQLGLLSPNETFERPDQVCEEIEQILYNLCESRTKIDIMFSAVEFEIKHKDFIDTKNGFSSCRYTYYLQEILNTLGYEINENTSTTYQVVRKFQKDVGIQIDGKVGSITLYKLKEAWENQKTKL